MLRGRRGRGEGEEKGRGREGVGRVSVIIPLSSPCLLLFPLVAWSTG
jgi:hypothetical protein